MHFRFEATGYRQRGDGHEFFAANSSCNSIAARKVKSPLSSRRCPSLRLQRRSERLAAIEREGVLP